MKKDKVGIITVYGENNFGNKLQNYASKKLYNELGLNAETLKVMQSRMQLNNKEKIKIGIKKIIQYIPKYKYLRYQFLKEEKFKKFSINNLNITKSYNTASISKEILEEYGYLSVGSDQVWNDTDFDANDMQYFSLNGIESPKIIALSPSMGKTSLCEKNKEILKSALINYKAISCREEAGAKYISEISGRKCEILVDPTMALKKEDWNSLKKKPEWLNSKNYAMCYFLGGMEDKLEIIKKKCNDENIEMIDILDKRKESYNTSPEEFIYLISNADMVFTDSFHACVFSIIFDTSFSVFKRQNQESNMNSRIDTLFKLFGVNEYKYGEVYNFGSMQMKENILDCKRKEITSYLKSVLG